jgi:hypothetical protein
MMRWCFGCCLAVIVVQGSAWARPVLEISPQLTTKQVFDACGADDPSARAEDCDRLFQGLMRVAYDAVNSPVQKPGLVCLPDREPAETFRLKIIGWLGDHPEVQSLEFIGEGSRQAFVGAYACK